MNEEQHQHLNGIRDRVVNRLSEKYTAGAMEHGGLLWEKEGLLDMAIDEVIDLLVYLYTERDRQEPLPVVK